MTVILEKGLNASIKYMKLKYKIKGFVPPVHFRLHRNTVHALLSNILLQRRTSAWLGSRIIKFCWKCLKFYELFSC